MNRKKKFLAIPIFIAVFAAAIAIVMLLWNALIPSIVGWTTINFWQAAGLMILCRLLLGGFGRFGKFGPFGRFGNCNDSSFKGRREDMDEFRKRVKNMSRDERREFILKRMRPEFSEEDNAQPEQ